MMITNQFVLEMGKYNKWQNEVLYQLCEAMGEVERKKIRGMFFKSIHNTLNHILLIDEGIFGLIHSGTPRYLALDPSWLHLPKKYR